ncbi:signal peptidase I [Candidatus Symbiobacter mobilis]|nr:signal peptidase I [Candidatus Symbiobacter mobilis]
MPTLTGILLAAFGTYIAAWYTGNVEGNFALLLFCATVVTGVYWLAEQWYFAPHRRKAALHFEQQARLRRQELQRLGVEPDPEDTAPAKAALLAQPWWLDWTAGLFPVIAVVFLLRSFLFEPFKIPSGSMMPTLLIGDLILVNKFEYGLRLPVLHTRLTMGALPQRGDVIVFRYPPKPSLDYIKRVVGLPGDEVAYRNKTLTINGSPIPSEQIGDFFDDSTMRYYHSFEEQLGARPHKILLDERHPAWIAGPQEYEHRKHCRYSVEGVVCRIPAGHYFVLGDNRDNSLDSRYWGFVPEQNIVGRAFFVWMNFTNPQRIGSFH